MHLCMWSDVAPIKFKWNLSSYVQNNIAQVCAIWSPKKYEPEKVHWIRINAGTFNSGSIGCGIVPVLAKVVLNSRPNHVSSIQINQALMLEDLISQIMLALYRACRSCTCQTWIKTSCANTQLIIQTQKHYQQSADPIFFLFFFLD